jgi:nitrate reductase molybdenum cofactor assembly chaperone NarJ/NarW
VRPDIRVVHQVASWCLTYPDRALDDRLPQLDAALAEQPAGPATDPLRRFLGHLASLTVVQRQHDYVATFDLTGKHALYLSYWTDGDTRRRGEVLGRFKQRYRDSGFLVDTRGELPDFLPMVLEYAAVADPDAGRALLQEYRPSLELLRIALAEADTPYADVLVSVCSTLPGASPQDRAAVMRMAGAGPPTESVGLEPYDPRLLPLADQLPGAR